VHQVAAAERGDRQALQATAEQYERLGMHWLAGETAAAAMSGAARSELNAGWAVQAKRLVNRLHDDDQLVVPGWWGTASEMTARLTAREQEIAEAVVGGETSAQIAERLSLSRRTVENHVQHIFRKVGVSRREDLAIVFGTVVRRDNSQVEPRFDWG
jgi:DNA-binding NarL/FixJ family response regulator